MFLFSLIAVHYVTFDVYGTLLNMSSISERIMEIAKENEVDPDEAATTYSSSEDEMMYGEEYSDLDNKIKRALFWTDTYLNSNCFENAYERVIDAYNNLNPFPEVVDTLKVLRSRK